MLSHTSFSRNLPKIHFYGKGVDITVDAPIGKTISQIAEMHKLPLPSACEGSGACATCQVYVEKGADNLPEPTEAEYDTLDYAPDIRDESRLGCRCTILKEGEDMEVQIPKHSRNLI